MGRGERDGFLNRGDYDYTPLADQDTLTSIPQDVLDKFEELTLLVIARGFRRYSADAILHRVRWHEHVERGNQDFKCNNNWTSRLARWFIKRHPKYHDFFELRASPGTVRSRDDD